MDITDLVQRFAAIAFSQWSLAAYGLVAVTRLGYLKPAYLWVKGQITKRLPGPDLPKPDPEPDKTPVDEVCEYLCDLRREAHEIREKIDDALERLNDALKQNGGA